MCNSSARWLNCYGIGQASHFKLPNSIPVVLFLTVSAVNAQTYLNSCYCSHVVRTVTNSYKTCNYFLCTHLNFCINWDIVYLSWLFLHKNDFLKKITWFVIRSLLFEKKGMILYRRNTWFLIVELERFVKGYGKDASNSRNSKMNTIIDTRGDGNQTNHRSDKRNFI